MSIKIIEKLKLASKLEISLFSPCTLKDQNPVVLKYIKNHSESAFNYYALTIIYLTIIYK